MNKGRTLQLAFKLSPLRNYNDQGKRDLLYKFKLLIALFFQIILMRVRLRNSRYGVH